MTRTQRAATLAAGIAIVATALGLRLAGLRFGLPAVYNQDEVAIMSRALAFAKGDLNPHNYLYPTLYFYVLFGWVGGYYAVARTAGWVASAAAFQASFFTDPTGIYVAGRTLSVVCGLATLWFVWSLASRIADRRAGWIASLFVAVAPFAVRDAHYVKHDVPATLAVMAATLASWRLWSGDAEETGRRQARDVIVASLLAGIAASTHYYAVFLTVPLVVGVWLRTRGGGSSAVLRALVVSGAAFGAAFVLCSPFLLPDWQTAWRDIVANRQIVVDRAAAGGVRAAAFGRYMDMLWNEAIGWPVVALSLVGLMRLAWKRPRQALFLSLFPALFLAFICNTVPATRYLNPVLPFVAVVAAIGVETVAGIAGRRAGWLAAACAVLASVPGVVASAQNDWLFRQTDTRSLALGFIQATVPTGATILVQPYSVPLPQSHASLRESLDAKMGDWRKASVKFALRLSTPEPVPAYRLVFLGDGGMDADKIYIHYADVAEGRGLTALRRAGIGYVVLKRYDVPDAAATPLQAALAREGRLLATVSPYIAPPPSNLPPPFLHNTDARLHPAVRRPGPIVDVWEVVGTR